MFFSVVLCDQARIQPRVTGFPLTPLARNLPNLLLAQKEKKNNRETSVRGGVSVWIRRVLLLLVKTTQIRAATCECTVLALAPPPRSIAGDVLIELDLHLLSHPRTKGK